MATAFSKNFIGAWEMVENVMQSLTDLKSGIENMKVVFWL